MYEFPNIICIFAASSQYFVLNSFDKQYKYNTENIFQIDFWRGQKVSGYVTNITETIEEDKPSIITSVQTEPVTYADCHFLENAVHNTERVTGQHVKNVYADEAYQSPENRDFARLHMGMGLLTSKLQGGCRYLLDREPGTDNLKVTDTETSEIFDAIYVGENNREGKHWRVKLSHVKPSHPWRYFNEEEARRSELRRKIEGLPPEEQHKRNNIEAAMFQYSFHTRNGKTRYRGLFRHRLQAFLRCMWMNLRRWVLFLTTKNQRPLPEPVSSLIDKVWNLIYRLIAGISDPIKVFREYFTLLVDISIEVQILCFGANVPLCGLSTEECTYAKFYHINKKYRKN